MAQPARSKSLALIVALSTVASVAFTATPVRADEESPKQPTAGALDVIGLQDLDGHQGKLTDLKTWILERQDLANSGYVESVNDVSSLTTTLLWHGPENGTQRAIVAEAQRRGIKARIEQRKFGLKQIEQAVEAITKRGDRQFDDFIVASVTGITAGFDGIKIEGLPSGIRANSTAGLAGRVIASSGKVAKPSGRVADASGVEERVFADVAKDAADRLGVDVMTEPGIAGVNFVATRVSDTLSFNAGGLMVSRDGARRR